MRLNQQPVCHCWRHNTISGFLEREHHIGKWTCLDASTDKQTPLSSCPNKPKSSIGVKYLDYRRRDSQLAFNTVARTQSNAPSGEYKAFNNNVEPVTSGLQRRRFELISGTAKAIPL
ncbi:hypothetical protein OH492_26145 [Vibrio chagasii]|nr:hypothetical protein [Vibrio chagasii]